MAKKAKNVQYERGTFPEVLRRGMEWTDKVNKKRALEIKDKDMREGFLQAAKAQHDINKRRLDNYTDKLNKVRGIGKKKK